MLVEDYEHNAQSKSIRRQWFRRFKNHNFDLEDKEREVAPKGLEDTDMEVILVEDTHFVIIDGVGNFNYSLSQIFKIFLLAFIIQNI